MKQSTDLQFSTNNSGQAAMQRCDAHLTIGLVKPEGTVARLAEPCCICQKGVEDRL